MKVFKIIVAWPISWMLYYIGHIISLVFTFNLPVYNVLYPIYDRLMLWSIAVQEWYHPTKDDYFPWKLNAVYSEGDCY
jgi:hypothetical protein